MADHARVGLKSLSLVFVLLLEFNRGFFYSLLAVKIYYLFYYAVL